MTKNPCQGFSLIELIVIMVIISAGLIGMSSMFGNSATSLTTNETVQQATQYAQECAESAMATKRNFKFDWFLTNEFPIDLPTTDLSCSSPINGFTRTVTLTPAFSTSPNNYYTGTSSTACPDTVHCRDITITVTKGALSSSITIMLADY